jgi:hypothetical protein
MTSDFCQRFHIGSRNLPVKHAMEEVTLLFYPGEDRIDGKGRWVQFPIDF